MLDQVCVQPIRSDGSVFTHDDEPTLKCLLSGGQSLVAVDKVHPSHDDGYCTVIKLGSTGTPNHLEDVDVR